MADEIREQIREAEELVVQCTAQAQEALAEVEAAKERQMLRRRLDAIRQNVSSLRATTSRRLFYGSRIDRDQTGPALPENQQPMREPETGPASSVQQIATCCDAIEVGEQEWAIQGMSWLKTTLTQLEEDAASSKIFAVGEAKFRLHYAPTCVELGTERQYGPNCAKGSLVLQTVSRLSSGCAFRFSFFIKRRDEWVQWGESEDVAYPNTNLCHWVFGPDVDEFDESPADGIFGLSHDELLGSEWIEHDALTVKVKLEVRACKELTSERKVTRQVDVPNPELGAQLLVRDTRSPSRIARSSHSSRVRRRFSKEARALMQCALSKNRSSTSTRSSCARAPRSSRRSCSAACERPRTSASSLRTLT